MVCYCVRLATMHFERILIVIPQVSQSPYNKSILLEEQSKASNASNNIT